MYIMRRSINVRTLQRHYMRKILIIFAAAFFCAFICYFLYEDDEIFIGIGNDLDLSEYEPFEPILLHDFPTAVDTKPRISKIIHQTWKDIYIPKEFHANVRSFAELNPDYQYYFWSDRTARDLIAERHPALLYTFDTYVEPVRKADMLRYVVLFEFGGIYADLDTLCLRPLDRVLNKYACVISPEPYEHSSLIYNTKFMVTNSILFCRKHHPFLHKLMYNLPSFSHFSQDIDASGPNYVTLQLNLYNRDLKADKTLSELDNDNVYVPSSQYFQNQIDPVRFDQFKKMCRKFSTLNDIGRRGCVSLKRRGLLRRKSKYEFTRHSFFHTGYKWVPSSRVKISDLVKHVTFYDGISTKSSVYRTREY